MVTFRSNNNRRSPYRNNNNNRRTSFRRSDEGSKYSNNDNFQRKAPGRNNHNAPKLIEKYNDLAREALANEDKILSENYFQHADHFTRVQNEQETNRLARINISQTEAVKLNENKDVKEKEESESSTKKQELKKVVNNSEKKSAVS
jgi:hypothetical protein